jgi:hypothetical protein
LSESIRKILIGPRTLARTWGTRQVLFGPQIRFSRRLFSFCHGKRRANASLS